MAEDRVVITAPNLPTSIELRSIGPHSNLGPFLIRAVGFRSVRRVRWTCDVVNPHIPFTILSKPTIYRETHYHYGIQKTVQRPPRRG